MTRSGIFHENLEGVLIACWRIIGRSLIDLKQHIPTAGNARDRFLLDNDDVRREDVIDEIWRLTKAILPLTMSANSYGLVGASKVLFSVLPEIVLPVDNVQWKQLFKTVDIGDVIRFMVKDIQKWEQVTGVQFNRLDQSKRLTTLPSVYNVVAMKAKTRFV